MGACESFLPTTSNSFSEKEKGDSGSEAGGGDFRDEKREEKL